MWNRTHDTPCYKCTERHEHCHSGCEKYSAYKAKVEFINEKSRKDRTTSNAVNDILIHGNKAKVRRKYNSGITCR